MGQVSAIRGRICSAVDRTPIYTPSVHATLVVLHCRWRIYDVVVTRQSWSWLRMSWGLDVFQSQSQGSTYIWIALYMGIYGNYRVGKKWTILKTL